MSAVKIETLLDVLGVLADSRRTLGSAEARTNDQAAHALANRIAVAEGTLRSAIKNAVPPIEIAA